MLLASSVSGLFKWRQFEPKVILLAVGWYLRFSLSYVDETYIRVKGKWVYLYRAVDSTGATIDFLLSAKRDAAAAERFLAKAFGGENHPEPRVINTDKHAVYSPAIAGLQAAGDLTDNCQHRPVQYLNNVLEQDHRAIKRRVRASQHFRSFWGAWRTIAGYEAIHMMRKDQARGSAPAPTVGLLHRFILGLFAARSKFPMIYIDLRIDYKVATHPSPVRTAPILHAHRRVWSSRTW